MQRKHGPPARKEHPDQRKQQGEDRLPGHHSPANPAQGQQAPPDTAVQGPRAARKS